MIVASITAEPYALLALLAASPFDLVIAAPIVFIAGVLAGLGASSRWLLVRRRDYEKRQGS